MNGTLTQAELVAMARQRFGSDPMAWAFVCPNCGDVAVAGDFPEGSEQLGQYCVGNWLRSDARGCDWKAFGLFRGPWEIVMPDGHSAWSFALAPATRVLGAGDCRRDDYESSDGEDAGCP